MAKLTEQMKSAVKVKTEEIYDLGKGGFKVSLQI